MLNRLEKRITDDPQLYMMASIYEMGTELYSEIMGASVEDLAGIRASLLDSFVASHKRIEGEIPAVISDVSEVLCDTPRTALVGSSFNLPKKIPLSLARFIDPKRRDAGMLFNTLENLKYPDGTSVLDLSDETDQRILNLLASARKGNLYARPAEVAEAVSAQTDHLLDVGRMLTAPEKSIENKSEVADALTVALGVDCENIDNALRVIGGDTELPNVAFQEKLDRLRMLKLTQAINSVGTRNMKDVETYAMECMGEEKTKQRAEDRFVETLQERFPGMYFTEEDSIFFFETMHNTDKYLQYQKLDYC